MDSKPVDRPEVNAIFDELNREDEIEIRLNPEPTTVAGRVLRLVFSVPTLVLAGIAALIYHFGREMISSAMPLIR